jgi:peptide/nickel transport system substrate-binding protein
MWKNNEVDLVAWATGIREQLRKEEPDVFYNSKYPTNWYYRLIANKPPLDDLNVRRALVHAVDWAKAVNAAWEGARNDRAMTGILTPELRCFKKDIWPDFGFNVAKAKEELAKSKYGSVDKLGKIFISATGGTNFVRLAEVMAEQWKQNLGLSDVDIKPTLDGFGQDKDRVQIQRSSAGALIPDPMNLLSAHYNAFKDPKGMALEDAELAKLIDDLNFTKRDDPKFCELCQKAEAKLLSYYLIGPGIWDIGLSSAKSWVKNHRPTLDLGFDFVNMYIAKH